MVSTTQVERILKAVIKIEPELKPKLIINHKSTESGRRQTVYEFDDVRQKLVEVVE